MSIFEYGKEKYNFDKMTIYVSYGHPHREHKLVVNNGRLKFVIGPDYNWTYVTCSVPVQEAYFSYLAEQVLLGITNE